MKNDENNEFIKCLCCNRVSYCCSECQDKDSFSHSIICKVIEDANNNSNFDDEEDSTFMLVAKYKSFEILSESENNNELITMNNNNYTNKIKCIDLLCGDVHLSNGELKSCNKIYDLLKEYNLEMDINKIIQVVKKDKGSGFAIMVPSKLREEINGDSYEEEDGDYDDYDDDDDNPEQNKYIDDNSNEVDDNDDEWEDVEEEDDAMKSIIRGYGIYPHLALVNHSCIPNCIRWDNVDNNNNDNNNNSRRSMRYVSLHDIPIGTELLTSYVPISWNYSERQDYLKELFGFECKCLRCILENPKKSKKHKIIINNEKNVDKIDKNYVNLYLLKYLCREGFCTGSMSPIKDYDANDLTKSYCECNTCGRRRSDADFLKELQEMK
jgi:hypothetical protein